MKVERSRSIVGRVKSICYSLIIVSCVLVYAPAQSLAQTTIEPFPSSSGSGYYDYDGTSLTFSAATTLSMIYYSVTEFAFSPMQDPAIGGIIQLTDVDYTGGGGGGGAGTSFTDGTFSITVGAVPILTADIINIVLNPTSGVTGAINAGLTEVNLAGVVVNQPAGGNSRFIDDWITASAGSGLGAVQITLSSTTGTIDPLTNPSSGSALMTLQPAALPEPATSLLMLMGCGSLIFNPRRRR